MFYNDLAKYIHREGYVFIFLFAAASCIFSTFSAKLGWIGFILTIWCIYFFRNPTRITPAGDSLIISPADGVVQNITHSRPPAELGMGEEELTRVSIFLSVFDVHVNRVPANGKVTAVHYHPGKFLNASLDKASIHNERQAILMKTDAGPEIAFVQIAGLIAKRIVCDLENGQEVKAGQRFGIIRFGSRMDIYLPKNIQPLVAIGQTMIGGESIIADLASKKVNAPKFEIR
jgi:phosphatidylserine decarboxylase